jgi:hypothetical protein
MKDYIVESVKVWGGNKTQKRDDEGYMMMSLTFKGITSEPVDYKAKIAPEVGSSLKGELVDYVSNAGNSRTRLETLEYKKKENMKQDTITAQFALRLAVENATDHTNKDEVMGLARYFLQCVKELVNES